MSVLVCFNTTLVTVLWSIFINLYIQLLCFNTTLVTVLFLFLITQHLQLHCFNTTLVTVLLVQGVYYKDICTFQYNSCYCSIRFWKCQHNRQLVSIQLLLLFYTFGKGVLYGRYWFQYNSCYCSMARKEHRVSVGRSFQYNSCYCSIYFSCNICF